MTTRKELVAALQLRYGSATFSERIRILDEFVALTGYHRKHGIRLLRQEPYPTPPGRFFATWRVSARYGVAKPLR